MAKPSSGAGPGKTNEEREQAKRVRSLTLGEIETILQDKKHKLYEPLLLRLAPAVVPRLTEVSGPEGGPIQIEGVEIKVRRA